MIEQMFSPELIRAIGWALVHSLWQGALFALLLAGMLLALRRFSAQARYVVAAGILCAFFLTFTFTLYKGLTKATATEQIAFAQEKEVLSTTVATPSTISTPVTGVGESRLTAALPAPLSFQQRMIDYFDMHLPLIVTLWLMGVLVLQLRFLGQLAFVQRLKVYGTERLSSKWAVTIQELEERLNIRKPVQYLTSFRVSTPMTIGWLQPAILFPQALLEELKESQIIAILAHELAHIKRNDFLVNLIQTLLCTLFFYHPGVWWISSRIEEEREHCCDDLAIGLTGKPVGYAKTLIQLKEKEMAPANLAMAYLGTEPNGFKYRITRLISGYLGKATYSEGIITALILVLSLGTAIYAAGDQQAINAVTAIEATKPESALEDAVALLLDENSSEQIDDATHPTTTTRTITTTYHDTSIPDDHHIDLFDANSITEASFSQIDTDDFELFMEAIYEGNVKLVRYFLEHDVELNQTDEHDFSPLMAAAHENQYEIAGLLIDKGVDVDFANSRGWTALIEAADEGAYETAELLIDAGAEINFRSNGSGYTALEMAASEGYIDILELLLNEGADINIGHGGATPLHWAAEEGKTEVIRVLLERGANINAQDEEGRTPLMFAAAENQTAATRLLIDKGADPEIKDNNNRSVLNYAAEEGAEGIFDELEVDFGSDELSEYMDIIIDAADEGEMAIVKRLVEAGADVNYVDVDGHSALAVAAREGELDVARYLLNNGADVNIRGGEDYFSPLFMAARESDPEMIRLLADRGADIEAKYSFTSINSYFSEGGPNRVSFYRNATPLIVAIEENEPATIRMLLRYKPNVNVTVGKQSYDVSEEFGWRDISRMSRGTLRENEKLRYDTRGWTPLMEAAEAGRLEVVNLLLGAGANPKAITEEGISALSIARELGHKDIVERLERP